MGCEIIIVQKVGVFGNNINDIFGVNESFEVGFK